MKKLILLIVLIMSVRFQTKAQSAEDIGYEIIFKILEQIGELKVYASVLEKGYNIAQHGLTIIGDIRKAEFNLHNAFFDSLKSVKPEIREMYAVGEIITLQGKIIVRAKDGINGVRNSKWLHPEEIAYAVRVFNTIIDNSDKNVTALINVTTSNKLSMNDGERIVAIQGIYNDVRKLYSSISGFTVDLNNFSYNRQRSHDMDNSIKQLYGF